MPDDQASFPNFREAYCAYHGCSAEKYVRHLLMRSVPLLLRPLARLTLMTNPGLFSVEVDAIQRLGMARSGPEVADAISELDNLSRVERSFWRVVGLKANPGRMRDDWALLGSHVRGPEVVPITELPKAPAERRRASAPVADGVPGRESPLMLRKLRAAQQEIVSGRPLAEVLRGVDLEEGEFRRQLEIHAPGNAALAWLLEALQARERVAALERSVEEMSRQAEEQTAELRRLRG
jgi:hypothetical protein